MKYLLNILILASILVSCVKEIDTVIVDPEKEISLILKLPTNKMPKTYALDEVDENTIREIDILAFKEDNGEDIFSYRTIITENEITDADGSVNGDRKKIKIKLKRGGDPVRLVIIANARNSVNDISDILTTKGVTKEEVMNNIIFDVSGEWPIGSDNFVPFPMWGESAGYISDDATTIDPVSLLRSIAKIDLGIDIYGDPALGFGKIFKLKHVYIYNVVNKGFVSPNPNDPEIGIDNPIASITHIPSNAVNLSNRLEYTFQSTGDNKQNLFNQIYITESDPDNTFIIVGGTYYDGPETYYKIGFTKIEDNPASHFPLLRNYRYLINIVNVKGEGYSSISEAVAAKFSNSVSEIYMNSYNIKDFEFNGQYMLGVDGNKKAVDWQEQSVQVKVRTDYGGGWTATVDQAASQWISLQNSSGSGGNTDEILNIDVSRNKDEFTRTGKIILKAGTLTKEIFIKQRLGANCYIVKPAESVSIPVAFANADGQIRVIDGMNITARLIWQDRLYVISDLPVVSGNGKDAIIQVTGGVQEGNAIIAAINSATGDILWSWHVWVTNYNPDLSSSQDYSNGKLFMKRNLGAISTNSSSFESYGLFYQWGRKDPFPGPASISTPSGSFDRRPVYDISGQPVSITFQQVMGSNEVNEAVENPTVFYINSSYPFNWNTNNYNNLWEQNGEKAPYDPSPDGWKIPGSGRNSLSPWYGFTSTNGTWDANGGRLWDAIYYPAAGSMDPIDGSFIDVGQRCYVWTASPLGFQAFSLNFGISDVNINASAYRANGFPVRCVQDTD